MSSGATGGFAVPGFQDARETVERSILWGQAGNERPPAILFRAVIDSATVDSGSTPTTDLRPGLVLAQLSDGSFTNYDPTSATAEQRVAVAINALGLRMTDIDANAVDRFCTVLVGGAVKAGQLIGLDYQARQQLSQNFIFDDDLQGQPHEHTGVLWVATAQTLTASQSGLLIATTGTGAVTHVLPAIATSEGVKFEFLNMADQNLIIASAEGDNIVAINDVAADSLAFQTASEKIGARLQIECVRTAAGLKWIYKNLTGATITVAT